MKCRTFASVSRAAILEHNIPEKYELAGWQSFIDSGMPILDQYKSLIQNIFVQRSQHAWRHGLISKFGDVPHLLVQVAPTSVASRFLELDELDILADVDEWERLRLGHILVTSDCNNGKKLCTLCYKPCHGVEHLLTECECIAGARSDFLNRVDHNWKQQLTGTLPAHWPT
eukprot:11957214-Karenia_brevis.AAC.1